MWRRFGLLIFVLGLFLIGCSQPQPRPRPLPPDPPSMVDNGLCRAQPPSAPNGYREREQALIAAVEKALVGITSAGAPAVIQAVAPCLITDAVPGSEGGVLTVRLPPTLGFNAYGLYGIGVWLHGDKWRVASLQEPGGNGSTLVDATPSPDGWEVTAQFRVDGSGVMGAWRLYHLGTDLVQKWQSPIGSHFSGKRVRADLLLSTYLDSGTDWELTQDRYCCGNRQELWGLSDGAFTLKAKRLYPSPVRTAKVFVAAVRQGKLDRAAELVTEPSVLEAVLARLGRPATIQMGDRPALIDQVEESESAHWEEVPSADNGPPPTVTSLSWPAEPGALQLRRVDGEWKVAGWAPD